jgi:hypothetical protein
MREDIEVITDYPDVKDRAVIHATSMDIVNEKYGDTVGKLHKRDSFLQDCEFKFINETDGVFVEGTIVQNESDMQQNMFKITDVHFQVDNIDQRVINLLDTFHTFSNMEIKENNPQTNYVWIQLHFD